MRSFRLSQQQTLLGVEWTENHSRHSSLIQWSSLGNNELVSVKLCFFQEHFNPLTFPSVPLYSHLFQVGRSPVRCTVTLAFSYIHRVDDFIIHHRYPIYRYLSLISDPLIKHSSSGIHLIFLKFSLNYLPLLTPEFSLLSMLPQSIQSSLLWSHLSIHSRMRHWK